MADANLMQTRFGSREICNVTFKAKSERKIGNKTFAKGEPVFIFDSLKTSSLESAATTVYATGGRGNTRLVAWEGEKTVTFTMEDALISPLTFSILSGAGLEEYVDNTLSKDNINVLPMSCVNIFAKGIYNTWLTWNCYTDCILRIICNNIGVAINCENYNYSNFGTSDVYVVLYYTKIS